ncbi:MAG: phosphatidylglycerophosphatase A [Patescibacteria group bacterium]|nr:phosphatidylglycerophosphatase A [Patescibacteria group bacterium]
MWCVPLAEVALGPRRDWKGRVRTRDQNQIVIDEVLGMLIVRAPVTSPRHAAVLFPVAFGLFRLFDITKPWPIKFFDRKKSAFGVMWDDVVAGCYAAFGVGLFSLLL